MFGFTAAIWNISAEREHRYKMPEPGKFFPSRWYSPLLKAKQSKAKQEHVLIRTRWSKQIIEHEKAMKGKESES